VVTSVLNPIGIAGQLALAKQRLARNTRRIRTGQIASRSVVGTALAEKAT
jgi:hypothetical protein